VRPSVTSRFFALAAAAVGGCLMTGCSSPPVPDEAYYRLPTAREVARRETPAIRTPIVVDTFLADGVHGEQAILYQLGPEASIKAYHYQQWDDPPVRMLQRRLIRRLRDEGVATTVADRLPSGVDSLRIIGLIERFERVETGDDQWEAHVRIEMRVDSDDPGRLPRVLKSYSAVEPAESQTMQATVRAFARAVDRVFDEFVADLVQKGG
jgi:cholesterol transport system auxiliary component